MLISVVQVLAAMSVTYAVCCWCMQYMRKVSKEYHEAIRDALDRGCKRHLALYKEVADLRTELRELKAWMFPKEEK